MSKTNLSVILADDHPLMLTGLQQELEQAGYKVVATATNGTSALEAIHTHNPDIAFLDIEMPFLNGFEVVNRLKDQQLDTRFIMMSYHRQKGFVVQAKTVGVQGYLLKEDSFEEIALCIAEVMKGNYYYSKSFEGDFETMANEELRKISLLTPSERTIIRLISQNKTSLEICETLNISKRTVEKHRTNIIAKLELEPVANTLSVWINSHTEIINSL
ncbi:response regulator [Algoriphagus formosus]|uniref:Response regulator transcription factor n=1 Tax=Algoriphagus formosus TaxID=2007308 RepID=A0A4R5VF55_9BACT|nr:MULTISPECIES: response regulator transcription factor [Algoriphagus]TDK51131.1 response regulator transcription factor [Algoriphagus aquimaris]